MSNLARKIATAPPEVNVDMSTWLVPDAIDLKSIPATSHVRRLGELHQRLTAKCEKGRLPDLDQFVQMTEGDAMDFCTVLVPVAAEAVLDFVVLRRGVKLPGSLGVFRPGERYSEHIVAHFLNGRLIEFCSSLVLKSARFTFGNSARPGALNIQVYRAILPLWFSAIQKHGIILCVAPV